MANTYAYTATRMSTWGERRFDDEKPKGPYDRCPDCGGWKAQKAYRCRWCTPLYLEAAQRRWTSQRPATQRKRARAVRPELPGTCERCGEAKPLERHHLDGNPGNNAAQNIAALCRRCHMEVDGRLARFSALPKPSPRPPTPCEECGRLFKPLRRGLCAACYERRRRASRRSVCHSAVHDGRLHL